MQPFILPGSHGSLYHVHTAFVSASMYLLLQLEDLTKIHVFGKQWSISAIKLFCRAWQASSLALFRFSPVILHPKCVNCLDLGGQGMQPSTAPALSCPFGGLQKVRCIGQWSGQSV